MKKIVMSVLFAVAAAVLFVSSGFAQSYFGVEVYDNAPEINVSSSVSIINNVFQPVGSHVVLSSMSYYEIGGAHIYISTYTNIGNVTANGNALNADGLHIYSGDIFGSQLSLQTADGSEGVYSSVGNVASNKNFVSVKNSSFSYATGVYAVYADISGAELASAAANSNKVEINNSKLTNSNICGFHLNANISSSAFSVNSNENEISITSSSVNQVIVSQMNIYGISNIISDNNKITISNSSAGGVCGFSVYLGDNGFDQTGSVRSNGNSISITSSSLQSATGGSIFGDGVSAVSNGNKIAVSYSAIYSVYGADVYNYANFDQQKDTVQANNNSVSISNSSGSSRIIGFGAYCEGDNVISTGNSLSIADSLSAQYIYGSCGGWANFSGKINGNSVFVKNTSIVQGSSVPDAEIYGGYLYGGDLERADIGYGGFEANNNSVRVENLNGSTVSKLYGAYNDTRAGTGTANANTVYILNSGVNEVCGGYIESVDNDITTEEYANGNSVTVKNSTAAVIYGGYSISALSNLSNTSASGSGDGHTLNVANGNSVSVSNGSVGGEIFGGLAHSETSNAQANNNSVILENVSGSVKSVVGGDASGNFDEGQVKAVNNTVTITGNLDVGLLYGGSADNSGTGGEDYFTGNTLNVKYGYITASGMGGFQNYNFYAQNSVGTTPIISVSSGNGLTNSAIDISGAQVNIFLPKDVKPAAGDRIVLIYSNLSFTGFPKKQIMSKQGMCLNVFDISVDFTTDLSATFVKKIVNPDTKSLSEGAAAGAILAGGNAADSGLLAGLQEGKLEAVGAVFDGSSKYNTGSSVQMDALGAAAGLAKKFGTFSAAVAVEYSNGSFDTDYNGTKGSGKATTIGGSVLAKKDMENVYVEGLIRAGQLSNDYKTKFTDENGITPDYDYTSIYFGLGLGAGYIYKVNEKVSLDCSGKYMLTNVGGNEVTTNGGYKYKLDSVLSNKLKAGVKGEYNASESVKPYAAISYEYELSGKVKAQIDGGDIETPTLTGGTLSGGVGASAKVIEKLTLDLSVQGYTGAREGFMGLLKLKYEI